MGKKFFLLIFLLLLPLALASTVDTNKGKYTPSESVTITVTGCVGSSILTISNSALQAVFSDQGENDWQTSYHTSSDPSTGTYTITAFCDAEEFSTTFKVEEEAQPSDDGNGGGTSSTGGRCISEWSCGPWAYCGPDLIQTRTCTDLKYCLPDKTETQPCLACDESWVCSIWSNCIAGKQTRLCNDEHLCGTVLKKPILQKACNAPDTGPPPARIAPPQQLPPPAAEPSFWDEYKLWIILIPAILILIAAGLLFYFYVYKKRETPPTNITPLKNWVRNAQAKGVPEEKIKEIVHNKTKWTDKELDRAFKELGSK